MDHNNQAISLFALSRTEREAWEESRIAGFDLLSRVLATKNGEPILSC